MADLISYLTSSSSKVESFTVKALQIVKEVCRDLECKLSDVVRKIAEMYNVEVSLEQDVAFPDFVTAVAYTRELLVDAELAARSKGDVAESLREHAELVIKRLKKWPMFAFLDIARDAVNKLDAYAREVVLCALAYEKPTLMIYVEPRDEAAEAVAEIVEKATWRGSIELTVECWYIQAEGCREARVQIAPREEIYPRIYVTWDKAVTAVLRRIRRPTEVRFIVDGYVDTSIIRAIEKQVVIPLSLEIEQSSVLRAALNLRKLCTE